MARKKRSGGEIVVVNTGGKMRQYAGKAYEFHQKTGIGFALAAGVGTLILTTKTVQDIDFFKKNWWGLAIGVLVLGWLLWKRQYKYASALIAVGAVLLVQAWRAKEAKEAASKGGEGNKTTEGVGGGFRWLRTPDGQWVGYPTASGGETSGPGSMEWVQTSSGEWVGVPALPARRTEGPSAEQLAEQITRQTFSMAA